MNELETEATNLKVAGDKYKGLIATKKFKKGELIMTPFTNIVAFAADGSYLQKALMREFLKVSVPDRHGGACAFLKPPKLTYGLVDDASTFIVPFWATYANPTSDTKTANMVEFSYKAKGGITIPCIKNNVPIDEGDVIVMFRGKKSVKWMMSLQTRPRLNRMRSPRQRLAASKVRARTTRDVAKAWPRASDYKPGRRRRSCLKDSIGYEHVS
jgi:hypothetical protein